MPFHWHSELTTQCTASSALSDPPILASLTPSKPGPHGCCCQVLLPAGKGAWPLWTTAAPSKKCWESLSRAVAFESQRASGAKAFFLWMDWHHSLGVTMGLLSPPVTGASSAPAGPSIFLRRGFLCQVNQSIIFKVSYTEVPRTRAEWSQICGQIPHEWPQPSWYLSPSKTWLQSTFLSICDSQASTRTTQ